MLSLTLDLQNDIYNSEVPLSKILRKAHVLARKLGLSEFDSWLDKELNGYPSNEVPYYRKVKGELKAWNPYNGWIPFLFNNNKEMEQTVCVREIVNSVINIEELLKDSNSISLPMPGEANALFSEMTGFQTHYSIFFSKSSISNIMTIVRNKVLDWTLKLEDEDILGEDMQFTQEEKQKAEIATQTINNFYGVTNYNNGSIEHQQICMNNTIDYKSAEKKLDELEQEINSYQLDKMTTADLKDLIKDAKSKIKQKRSPSIIRTALKAICEFAMSTASAVVVSAINAKLNGII